MSLVLTENVKVDDLSVITEKMYTYNFSLESGEKLRDSFIFKGNYKKAITDYLLNYVETKEEYKDNLNSDYKNKINEKINYTYYIDNENIVICFSKYEILPGSFGNIKVKIPYTAIEKNMNIDIKNPTKIKSANIGVKTDVAKYKDLEETVYAKGIVNVLKKDNKNSEKIGELNQGDMVKRISTSDTGWSKITYNNETAYVSSTYLSTDPISFEGYETVNETVYVLAQVHVRPESNVNCDILATLERGTSVTRIGVGSNGWSEVIYNDATAYLYSSFLSTKEPGVSSAVDLKIDPQRNIDASKPMVALTFDDGPNPYSTVRILDTLQKYNAVATFFDLGSLITTYPKISLREEALGCEVESHTYSHANLNTLSEAELQAELQKSVDAYKSVLGKDPVLVRPPYGNANATVRSVFNLPLINWDIDTEDWKSRNKDSILAEINKYSDLDGRIILMHSIYGSTADAVETLVPDLIQRGYQLVTVSELAYYKNVTLETGKIYYDFR